MKIRVDSLAGGIEVLTLVPPVTVSLGNALNVIHEGSGLDHYFDQDGYYDGWGMNVDGITPLQARELINRVEASRQVG